MTETATAPAEVWWRDLELAPGRAAAWRIGPLSLTILRNPAEWRLAYGWTPRGRAGSEVSGPRWRVTTDAEMPEAADNLERHVLRQTSGRVHVLPALADRPVVTSPRLPLFVLPDQEVVLYVGSPLWAVVEVDDPPRRLRELPIRRPSDTWFGPSTLEGELCYATSTRAGLRVEDLPFFSRRAVTPVRIRNLTETPLEVERLKLPVPYLSLYATPQGQLWTQAVTMTRSEEGHMANLAFGDEAPSQAGRAGLIAAPREESQRGVLFRAFGSLFRSEERRDAP